MCVASNYALLNPGRCGARARARACGLHLRLPHARPVRRSAASALPSFTPHPLLPLFLLYLHFYLSPLSPLSPLSQLFPLSPLSPHFLLIPWLLLPLQRYSCSISRCTLPLLSSALFFLFDALNRNYYCCCYHCYYCYYCYYCCVLPVRCFPASPSLSTLLPQTITLLLLLLLLLLLSQYNDNIYIIIVI